MLSDSDWVRISRYVAGETTDSEQRGTGRWIREDAEREQVAAELRYMWESRSVHVDTDAAWLRLVARRQAARSAGRMKAPPAESVESSIATPARTSAGPTHGGARTRGVRRFTARTSSLLKAAIWAGILVGGALVGRTLMLDDTGEPGATSTAMREAAATERGEIGRLRLGDGTEVVLGVASRLLVAEDYGRDARVVQLEGDGFFDIAHDAERPFVVRTAAATTQALGTAFGVLARDSRSTRVVVSEGRVRVEPTAVDARSNAVVTAGELARVTADEDTVTVEPTDPAQLLAWREGRLVFQNEPLADVLDELVHWYDVEFVLANGALGQRRLSGSFVRPTLEQVLEAITLTVDASYERDGRRVILAPNHGQRTGGR